MAKESVENKSASKKDIERLLGEQTAIILAAVESRIDKSEERFDKKMDKLASTLDHFLKRLTDFDDEFAIMKKEVNRIKAALRGKLGIEI